MKKLLPYRRAVALTLLTVFTAATFAPAAEAGLPTIRRVPISPYRTNVRVVHRSSSVGPVLAGVVGGLILGSALANANTHTSIQAGYSSGGYGGGYSYYDPYCDQGFSSIELYQSNYMRNHYRHPRIIRVIDTRSGDCVRNMYWSNGRWCEGDGGFQGRISYRDRGGYGGSYHQRGQWNGGQDRYRDGNDRWNDGGVRYKQRDWNRNDDRDQNDRNWNDRDGRDDRDWNDGDDRDDR